MKKRMQRSIQEAVHTLLRYGYQDCTEAASRDNGIPYLYAFERVGEEEGVSYCCVSEEDLFALVSLVTTSVST